MLNVVEYGSGPGRPLIVAHGLYGSARNWKSLAERLAEDRPVRVVDLRNHGDSPWRDSHRYEDLAADLAEVAGPEGADVLGHSMGGKAAMMLALTRPERVGKLIVVDIAPVAYDHDQLDLVRAMQKLDRPFGTRRAADEALAREVPDRQVRGFLLQSFDPREGRWSLNLDVLEREMDGILGWPDVTSRFEGAALFLAGGDSGYVDARGEREIARLFPKAHVVRIPDAGHWIHAEKPDALLREVRRFLEN